MIETNINRPFPIWVLNLERSRDRREYMEKQLKELNWRFEIIPAVDDKCPGPEDLKYYSAQQAIKTVERELTLGEIGCALSHAKMWERIVAENIEEVLILEDDIEIKDELLGVLERRHTFPEDWEFINFRTDVKKTPFGPPVYTKYRACHFQSYANRTCAYFINIKGAKKLCDHVYPIRLAADGLTGRTYISNLISYGIYPDLVELADFPSVRSAKVPGNFIDEIGGQAKIPVKRPTPAIVTPPLVSAIVSTYNAERFLRGCLEDLEAQTIADRLEIVVVDSGSSQNERTIVREFQQRYDNIVYIRTARRESIYAAWNRGIQAARGTYITNANTDDRHKRDAFERMVAALETRPDIALAYADAHVTRTENETFEAHTPVGSLSWPDFDRVELLRRCCIGPQPMWRKSLHATYGYFDGSFEVAGDWEFWLRMAENETFLHLREFLGLYLSSPAGAENRNHQLLGHENVRVYQRYVHRTDRRKNAGAVSGATAVVQPAPVERNGDLEHKPAVSCICLTYARPELLEEAIFSFLQQDYAGSKELIVLNDYDRQRLEFDHPEVRVINLPKRFRTLGEKRNMAVALASHDLLFVWDDDDICLPHRLSFSVAHFNHKRGFFKAGSAWFWNNGQLSGPKSNNYHGVSCWSRKLFDAVRGYGAAGSGEDLVFENLLERQFPGSTSADNIRPEEIYYLYRWSGTGSYHISGFGDYRSGANIGHHEVEAHIRRRAAAGEIMHGHIQLTPNWKQDYQQLVSDYLQLASSASGKGWELLCLEDAEELGRHVPPVHPAPD